MIFNCIYSVTILQLLYLFYDIFQNLFAFGDADGEKVDVKLQHPLAICAAQKPGIVYIADSYNHKVSITGYTSIHITIKLA